MAHEHSVYDTDTHFIIDGDSREVSNASQTKKAIYKGDHNSERLTFQLPRVIDGHDMTLCNAVQVHWNNVDASTREQVVGVYNVTDLQPYEDDESIITLSWLIDGNATTKVGVLGFSIRFSCVDENGKVTYAWNTAVHSELTVKDSNYNGDIVASDYADIFAEWEARISAMENAGGELAKQVNDIDSRLTVLEQNGTGGGSVARISYVDLPASGWQGEQSPYSQVVAVDGATENSQVDLTPSVEQLSVFYHKDLAFVTENEDGVVTVYAIGQKPANDYTIQVTITEVVR